MLEQVLDRLNNYFIVQNGVHMGKYEISGGTISLDFLQDGQYFKIVNSVFNDGVHVYPATDLVDEEFIGQICAMAVPKQVIALADEIEEWCTNNPRSAYVSEAFGGYSVTRSTGAGTGAPSSWEDVFRSRLNRWRKL